MKITLREKEVGGQTEVTAIWTQNGEKKELSQSCPKGREAKTREDLSREVIRRVQSESTQE